MTVPDTLSTRMTWAVMDKIGCRELLNSILDRLYSGDQQTYTDRDYEWSGPGVYRLQVRLNRPEGRPLYSLKWEGPL